ncbi:uncharacterized protein LOC142814484 [Rhipicephalus microplus]|uniref:uncharacterized protein LOC142814484 n=1 Tax=Rhipicephalus microplus TaxID=6941 RepID=UPI003F6C90B1
MTTATQQGSTFSPVKAKTSTAAIRAHCPDGCQSALNADCPVEAVFIDEGGATSAVVGKADATSEGDDIRNYARTRPSAVNLAVDQLFEAIMNGDVSDAALSDDEVADAQFVETETASDEEQGPTLHPAESETRHSDSDEPPPKKVKQVKWLAKAFDPGDTRCTY